MIHFIFSYLVISWFLRRLSMCTWCVTSIGDVRWMWDVSYQNVYRMCHIPICVSSWHIHKITLFIRILLNLILQYRRKADSSIKEADHLHQMIFEELANKTSWQTASYVPCICKPMHWPNRIMKISQILCDQRPVSNINLQLFSMIAPWPSMVDPMSWITMQAFLLKNALYTVTLKFTH